MVSPSFLHPGLLRLQGVELLLQNPCPHLRLLALDKEAAKKIVTAVVRQTSDRETNGPLTFSLSNQ